MANPLSADALAQVQKIAAKISVAHDLDSEIQAELRTHMEEKLLAYLSGEQKLSETDAILLTRAHFGNLATITSLFQRAHAHASHLSFTRRLTVAALATIILSAMGYWIFGLTCHLLFEPVASASGDRAPLFVGLLFTLTSLATAAFATVALWRVLSRWRRGIARGRIYWFQRWPLYSLLLLLAAVWYTAYFLIGFQFSTPTSPGTNVDLDLLGLIPSCAHYLLTAWVLLIWLRWCNQPSNTWRPLVYTAGCWLALDVLNVMVQVADMFHGVHFAGLLPPQRTAFLHGALGIVSQEFLKMAALAIITAAVYLLYRRYRLRLVGAGVED